MFKVIIKAGPTLAIAFAVLAVGPGTAAPVGITPQSPAVSAPLAVTAALRSQQRQRILRPLPPNPCRKTFCPR